jgi:hypothetical protein
LGEIGDDTLGARLNQKGSLWKKGEWGGKNEEAAAFEPIALEERCRRVKGHAGMKGLTKSMKGLTNGKKLCILRPLDYQERNISQLPLFSQRAFKLVASPMNTVLHSQRGAIYQSSSRSVRPIVSKPPSLIGSQSTFWPAAVPVLRHTVIVCPPNSDQLHKASDHTKSSTLRYIALNHRGQPPDLLSIFGELTKQNSPS